jgi:ribosomal protein S18 acetylase RimI-like enzyme
VAEAPDGRFAAIAGIWYVPALRHGQFEPVGTLADVRRRGLARAVMAAGLRHLADLGATQAIVDTDYDNLQANPLYAALGFTTVHVYEMWEKPF